MQPHADGAAIEMKRREFIAHLGTAATLSAFAAGFALGKAVVGHQDREARLNWGAPRGLEEAQRFERARQRPSPSPSPSG